MRTLLILSFFLLIAQVADAQRAVRIGVGFDALFGLPSQEVVPEGFGIGIRGRAAVPVNADLSFAGGLGLAGFILGGEDEASYVVNPQVSAIVTLPGSGSARYIIGGFGGFIPLSNDEFGDPNGGWAIHGGIGWAIPLRETSLYVEVNPSLVIGSDETTVVIPARIGVIF